MKEQRRKSGFGIRRRYLKNTIGLLILALLFSSVGVWVYVRKRMMNAVVDKYQFITEKMGLTLDGMFEKSDQVTGECIINEAVQRSLRVRPLEETEKNALGKYFAYAGLERVQEYLYVDNKQNLYGRSYSNITLADFNDSGFAQILGDDYAKTKWLWTEDRLFGEEQKALFIGRYVRALEYAHDPGLLFFKMDQRYLDSIIELDLDKTNEIGTGIADASGNIIKSWLPDGYRLTENDLQEITGVAAAGDAGGMITAGRQLDSGILAAYRQKESGFIVYTMIPNQIIFKDMGQIIAVLVGIYLLVIIIALNLSLYFSKRFTDPIKQISQAMTGFRGEDFSATIALRTNTELDQIGDSYNEMLSNIRQLLEEVKEQEKELRTSELNMLISQINPHFLYNTLDTIYMLARINKEETTMKMIQALSKYLRISLSKGSDMVTIADELENVGSYMEIQQIRNDRLFEYEVSCTADSQIKILKLILQPLVENAIKHGFCDIFEGGRIRISVWQEEAFVILQVANNGTPMDAAIREKINLLNDRPISDIAAIFPEQGSGYGVANIITRLRLKYGEQVEIRYQLEGQETVCTIRLPERGQTDEAI